MLLKKHLALIAVYQQSTNTNTILADPIQKTPKAAIAIKKAFTSSA